MKLNEFIFTEEEKHQALALLNNMIADRMQWRSEKITTTDYEIALTHNINDAQRLFNEAVKRKARAA